MYEYIWVLWWYQVLLKPIKLAVITNKKKKGKNDLGTQNSILLYLLVP